MRYLLAFAVLLFAITFGAFWLMMRAAVDEIPAPGGRPITPHGQRYGT